VERPLKQSAVLLILYPRDGRPWGIFTRRTDRVADHKGQISLPGGSRDPEDTSLMVTALRETFEELGINPAALRVVARMEPVFTVVTRYVITPYIAYSPVRPEVSPEEFEVAEVLDVPIDRLLDPSVQRSEVWESPVPRSVFFFDWNHGENIIWGATGRILKHLVDSWDDGWWRKVMSGEVPTFAEDDAPRDTGTEPTPV
jgi:8-oxo-dGTP pyrophosphatase MutT (NUDIX family)